MKWIYSRSAALILSTLAWLPSVSNAEAQTTAFEDQLAAQIRAFGDYSDADQRDLSFTFGPAFRCMNAMDVPFFHVGTFDGRGFVSEVVQECHAMMDAQDQRLYAAYLTDPCPAYRAEYANLPTIARLLIIFCEIDATLGHGNVHGNGADLESHPAFDMARLNEMPYIAELVLSDLIFAQAADLAPQTLQVLLLNWTQPESMGGLQEPPNFFQHAFVRRMLFTGPCERACTYADARLRAARARMEAENPALLAQMEADPAAMRAQIAR